MSSSDVPFTGILWLVVVGVTAIGAFLIFRARWGRRVGDTPFCRKCGYVLTGNVTGTCSECGTLFSENTVVRGVRPYRPVSLWSGILLLMTALSLAGMTASTTLWKIDWYQYRPTDWVIADLDSRMLGTPDRAWVELKRRIVLKRLSANQEHALVERALREQQSLTNSFGASDELVDYLNGAFAAGRMDASETKRFFDNEMKVLLTVRPVVGPKDSIFYTVGGIGRAPKGWWKYSGETDYWIDDKKVNHGFASGSSSFHGGSWGSSMEPQSIGKHRLRLDLKVTVGRGILPGAEPPVGDETRTLQVTSDFEVGAAPPPIAHIKSPDAVTVRTWFNPHGFRQSIDGHVYGTLQCDSPGVPMAFDVFARANDREYSMGSVNFRRSAVSSSWGISSEKLPTTGVHSIDLILRSSDEAAMRTIDMNAIWDGEVILSNVPIEQPAKAKK